ncbi:MAG: sulfurtransferase TusA family protein [Haloarculaceae archaeon]
MSIEHDVTETLDVKGQSCPMPVVKTKQAVDELEAGDVLRVLATDRGSMSDIAGWANSSSDVELLDQREVEDGDETVYEHDVRRVE